MLVSGSLPTLSPFTNQPAKSDLDGFGTPLQNSSDKDSAPVDSGRLAVTEIQMSSVGGIEKGHLAADDRTSVGCIVSLMNQASASTHVTNDARDGNGSVMDSQRGGLNDGYSNGVRGVEMGSNDTGVFY